MLKLQDINVTLGKGTALERDVLKSLSLEVSEGEFVVIIGGNGAGKSTLFNVISGALKQDDGSIFIDNKKQSDGIRASLVSKVIQDPKVGTIESMTILENMAFAFKRGESRGLKFFSNQNRIELFKEKLSMLSMGLENRLDDLVSSLSGGQRQALSLIMAVLQESRILLLDEITAALDPSTSDIVMNLTDKIVRNQKKTCIMITHDMSQAIRYGDRLLLLKNGRFIEEYSGVEKKNLTPLQLAEKFGEI
jgi:putative ABC transport system ATP-binding protein